MQCTSKSNQPSIYEEGFSKRELEERRKWIEQYLREARSTNDVIIFLLFGLPNSGKTTFIKQMKVLFGDPEDSCIPDTLKSQITQETLTLFRLISQTAIQLNVTLQDNSLQELCQLLSSSQVQDLVSKLDDIFASTCHDLWCSKEIGAIFDSVTSKFPSHSQYFLSHCKRIFSKNYNPSIPDYFNFPERNSSPVEEYEFICDGCPFRVVNVNQKGDRRKWIHAFENVNAVLFFADTTACFRNLEEDEQVNVFDETLQLFKELIHSKWFEYADSILFFTKRDLLGDMMLRAQANPSKRLKKYTGGCDYNAFLDWMKRIFIEPIQSKRHLYIHQMITTDSKNVELIFNCCKDITLHQTLDMSGLDGGFSSASVSRLSVNPGSTIGFAVGGAKDIVNFRKKIKSNKIPLSTDITNEGIFYEYYFDTSGKVKSAESTKLFYPSYSSAVCKNPFTQETECYLSVGLNSSMKEADFKRKKLNVIIVLDMSGSMSCAFDSEAFGQTKMQIANQSVVSLLNHLSEGDSFGLLAFDDKVEEVCPQKPFEKLGDISKLKEKILAIQPRGGTDLAKAMHEGHKILSKFVSSNKEFRNRELYENRMIFLTDCMPTIGSGSSDVAAYGLKMSKETVPVFTTYIGVGVDFDTRVVQQISKIPGANYFTVQSSSDFKRRMDDEFDFMVTPLVFDLKLSIQSTLFVIDKVIGSPEADMATGELMKVNTLFPSKKSEQGTKGGIILIKLKPKSNNNENNVPESQHTGAITLTSSYKDRSGNLETETQQVDFENLASIFTQEPHSYFDNTGIRKAILLSHYVELLQNWINTKQFNLDENEKEPFEKMIEVLNQAAEEVNDESLMQETQILDIILNSVPITYQTRSFSHYHYDAQARKFWCVCSECDNKDQTTV